MPDLVDAWDKETGERYPFKVPQHFIGHPKFGANLTDKEPDKQPSKVLVEAGKAAAKDKENKNA